MPDTSENCRKRRGWASGQNTKKQPKKPVRTDVFTIAGPLTGRAALLVGADVVGALDLAGVLHGDVAVGAGVVRAEGLAALGHLARVARAHHLPGVVDGGVAVRAADGVAVHSSVDGLAAGRGVACNQYFDATHRNI